MILEKILGGLFARLPEKYVWPAITVVLVSIAVVVMWRVNVASNNRELSDKDIQIGNLKKEVKTERSRGDSLLVIIITEKTNRINELAEDNRKLETKKEEVDDYIYENRLRDDINRVKVQSANRELKQTLKRKGS
jgi:hypothetical protein